MQVLTNAAVAAAQYALCGLSIMVVLRISHFLNFGLGALIAVGAYGAYFFAVVLKLPPPLAWLGAICLAGICSVALELMVYEPFSRRGNRSLVGMIASLGVYVVVQNSIAIAFGSDVLMTRSGELRRPFDILGGRVTFVQCLSVVLVIAISLALSWMNRCTVYGKMTRAAGNNFDLASVLGVNMPLVRLSATFIGACLAAALGILIGYDTDLVPTMGLHPFLMGVVAVCIGGAGSVAGICLSALLLGMAQHIGVVWLPTQWQDAIAFVILVLFLVIRPVGFFGGKVRRATV